MWAAWAGRAMAIGMAALPAFVSGCTAETTWPSSGGGGGGGGSAYPGTAGGGAAGSGSSSGGSVQPMLVEVDPNRTLSAQPGQGVGVFTEYVTGGQWHIWWTCDTAQTTFDCSFDVSVSLAGGAITNAAGQSLASTDQLLQSSASQIEVVTQTSTGISGVTFDTPPGSVITLDAKMNGQEDGAFLFFAQSGPLGQPEVNGGYHGTLTDPLMLEPSSP